MIDHDCMILQTFGSRATWSICTCGWKSERYESRRDAEDAAAMHQSIEEREQTAERDA